MFPNKIIVINNASQLQAWWVSQAFEVYVSNPHRTHCPYHARRIKFMHMLVGPYKMANEVEKLSYESIVRLYNYKRYIYSTVGLE